MSVEEIPAGSNPVEVLGDVVDAIRLRVEQGEYIISPEDKIIFLNAIRGGLCEEIATLSDGAKAAGVIAAINVMFDLVLKDVVDASLTV